MDPITDKEIKKMEDRAKAATKGEWNATKVEPGDNLCRQVWAEDEEIVDCIGDNYIADADFIAHSRQDILRLIKEIRRLRNLMENIKIYPKP